MGINRTLLKIVVAAGVLLIVFGLTFNTLRDMYIKSRLDARVELNQALADMQNADSYRYDLYSGFSVEGRKEVISEVEGEKSEGKTHIKGEMVNTPIDIYYIDRTIYNYDSVSEKWLVIESDTTNSEELLISELNPMFNFTINVPDVVEKEGFEEVDGTECLLVKCKTSAKNELLQTFWQDFEYSFWIDYGKGVIRKAVLQAKNKESFETVLTIDAVFYDINKKIVVNAPEINKPK